MFEFFYDNSLAIVVGSSLGMILTGLALSKAKSRPMGGSFPQPRSSDVYRTLARDAMNRNPNITYEKIKSERDVSFENPFGKRPMRKDPALGMGYIPPTRKPTIALTPRQIERINIVRKQQGREPFNRVGLKSAVSAAWDTPRREPATTNDWLTYLIMYEIFFADHQAPHCAGAGGILIDPNQPYNGAGGEFAGAGASGDWTSAPAPVAAIASGIAVGASAAYLASYLEDSNLNDPKYAPGDTVSGYGRVPDPIADGDLPSGSAMSKFLDDAPSNPPDSPRSAPVDTGGGSSPVSDSTPSYTSSPDSSSSGDSGGGSGGGGD